MEMNIPKHLLDPTCEVSVNVLDNSNTPSGSSSKRTLGSISASPAGKRVKLNIPSPTHITTASGTGKGLAGKALWKTGPKQTPRSAAGPASAISPDYLQSLSAVKQKKMVEFDNILESGAKETCKESIKASLAALGLSVNDELLEKPEQLGKDSFFCATD